MKKRDAFHAIDRSVVRFMTRRGYSVERWALSIIFLWFGLLKIFGHKSASSIIARSTYWVDPIFVVPLLGWWEVLIGISLALRPLRRLGILLLVIRLPGSLLALVYHYDECFYENILTPTIQGQYLLKELTLVGVALVIGSTVKVKDVG